MRIRPIEANSPTASPVTAPTVLNRRQKMDKTMTGKFPDAATAKASATRNATLAVGPSRMAMKIATAPTPKAEIRATSTSSPGLRSTPLWTTLVQKSCEKEVVALMVSPATTAKMVAKAMAEMNAKKIFPAEPGPRIEYHFRRLGSAVLACAYYGGNGGFCTVTTLAEVKEIDERAKDLCRYRPGSVIPHVMTGEAVALHYECVGAEMRREPYVEAFDAHGYMFGECKELSAK